MYSSLFGGMSRGMATCAYRHVVPSRFNTCQFLVRVMAGDACHLALQKASGLPEAIGLVRNLQPVVKTGARLAIEGQLVVRQRFARPVGECVSIDLQN